MGIPGRFIGVEHHSQKEPKSVSPLDTNEFVGRGPAGRAARLSPSGRHFRSTADNGERTEADGSGNGRAVRRRSVLLVEDDADSREMLAIVLMAAGCQVWTAADGRAALDTAAAHPIDLVITDFAMPRMDGIQMVRQLRMQPANSTVPVIVVTGQAVADVPDNAHAAGCTTVLSKPCCPDYLMSVVNQYIGTRRDDRPSATRQDEYRGRERRHS
jgi:two-component system chemotaxis response regulator CheY